jgi:hypothetical protein
LLSAHAHERFLSSFDDTIPFIIVSQKMTLSFSFHGIDHQAVFAKQSSTERMRRGERTDKQGEKRSPL